MKKLIFFLKVVGVLLGCLMMFSCNEPTIDEVLSKKMETKWERSLYNAMYIAECKTLSLDGYEYLGDVTNEAEKQALLNEIFSLDECMVVANYKDNNFDIMTYAERINMTSTKSNDLYAPRKNSVASVIDGRNIGVVELMWDYRGEKIISKAIVANDGEKEFIYDNILTYVPVDSQPIEKYVNENTRAQSSFSLFSRFYDHGPMTLSLEYAWQYEIQVTSYFDSNKFFSGSQFDVDVSYAPGWSCDAGVMTVSGEVGKTIYHEFMVGYAYGENVDVSVTNGGIGLNIIAPNGATSASFIVMHHSNQFTY